MLKLRRCPDPPPIFSHAGLNSGPLMLGSAQHCGNWQCCNHNLQIATSALCTILIQVRCPQHQTDFIVSRWTASLNRLLQQSPHSQPGRFSKAPAIAVPAHLLASPFGSSRPLLATAASAFLDPATFSAPAVAGLTAAAWGP